jgi:hypothetical protein
MLRTRLKPLLQVRRLGMAGWLAFCKHALFLEQPVTGVGQREAVLIFHLSRMAFSNPHSTHAQVPARYSA